MEEILEWLMGPMTTTIICRYFGCVQCILIQTCSSLRHLLHACANRKNMMTTVGVAHIDHFRPCSPGSSISITQIQVFHHISRHPDLCSIIDSLLLSSITVCNGSIAHRY